MAKAAKAAPTKARGERREIPGNLYYNTTPGALHTTLSGIVRAEKPAKVDQDFISTVLGVKGGSGKAQLPALKRMGLVDSSGNPTELYSKFRSDSKRSQAALEALRNAYASIFQRNSYAHKLPQNELEDLIVEITGLTKEDQIARLIYSCFEKIRSFITAPVDDVPHKGEAPEVVEAPKERAPQSDGFRLGGPMGLNYVINIVLPPSGNIETYNLIFKSLRENILDWAQ